MGGRGGSSGISAGGGGNPRSSEYKSAYQTEISDAKNFTASFAIEKGVSKSTIGWEMHAYQVVTGRSLIADTNNEIKFLKRELREANAMGTSYGMSKDAIGGMKAGLKEKISLREKALDAMTSSRSEYEKYKREAQIGNAKSKRRGGRYM